MVTTRTSARLDAALAARDDELGAALRPATARLTDEELAGTDPERLADDLVAGVRLLLGRDGPQAVRVRQLPDVTVVQLATTDRPFLLSTALDAAERLGHHVRLRLQPRFEVGADRQRLTPAPADGPGDRPPDVLLHLELVPPLPAEVADRLPALADRLVADVTAVVDGFPAMRAALANHAARLEAAAPTPPARPPESPPADAGAVGPDPSTDPHEVAALLRWLLDEHAVLLGARHLVVAGDRVTVEPSSTAGLSATAAFVDAAPPDLAALHPPSDGPPPVLVWTRSPLRAPVQRGVPMERVLLPERDAQGQVTAVTEVLLLFTRRGEATPVAATPLLRRRVAQVLAADAVPPGSHDDLVLGARADALPKDELFALDVTATRALLRALLAADDRRRLRTLTRVGPDATSASVLVAVPRDGYTAALRDRIVAHLRGRFDAQRVDVDVSLDDRGGALLRALLTADGQLRTVDARELEQELTALARDWITEVRELLVGRDGPGEADRLVTGLGRRLPRSYRERVDPADAATDLRLLDRAASHPDGLTIAWRRDATAGRRRWRLRLVTVDSALELSVLLPILESLGLTVVDEIPHLLPGEPTLHLHDVGVRVDAALDRALGDASARERANAALQAAWRGHAEVDRLGRLVLLADLGWRDVAVLRTYRRYRRQLGTPHTPAYVEDILVRHAAATAALVGRFRARFDPALGDADGPRRRAAVADAAARFEGAMTAVTQLDADRTLRGLSALVDATVRTTAFRHDACGPDGVPYVALKLAPATLADVPSPVPYREIFVHSPRVEGVHLRGGPVARGGLRWSDRRDDVRTEVLGLVKAQVLKNALIVPTGAKGGFVLADPPADPDALRAEGARQYVTFVSALLDLTDDLDVAADGSSTVVPPTEVVRHDRDDPYLVVAADKGTASLSDTANAVAIARGFWLGDAFASGGSAGYDHKALGVTARGAWRAVARHLRELGIDDQTDPVTVAGVGDLSGDVFSNGVLRSRSLRLIAAFDHRHVFLDPDPDPEASFVERERVAALPRSSWDDYDRSVLSEGGLIVPRDVRSVTLTPQVRAALRLDADEVDPPTLIRAILTAPVDVLWAGGIGTYVKASTERHGDVGDRANDEVRVDADRVRARVVGEGANLFLTPHARIELARRGARVDQDAIHNAAGVATSDAEVNAKILLDLAIADGRVAAADRDATLAGFADDVVTHVLDAVDRQVAALSVEVARSGEQLGELDAFVARLERTSDLDREVEVLPGAEEVAARAEAGAGLTRPELATLLAWAKRELKEALLASDAPDTPVLADAVGEPLPPRMVATFGDLLPRHRLRRELIATAVANACVDRLGITFASGLAAESGRDLPSVARAARVASGVVDADRWWAELATLEGVLPPERLLELHGTVAELVRELTVAALDDPRLDAAAVLRDHDAQVAARLLAASTSLGSVTRRRARRAHLRWLLDDLVPPDLAGLLAAAPDLAATGDVARVALATGRDVVEVADVTFRLTEVLGLERLDEALRRVPAGDGWSRRQHRGVAADLRRLRRRAADLACGPDPDAVAAPGDEDPSTTAAAPDAGGDLLAAPASGQRGDTGAADALVARFVERRRASLARVRATVVAATEGHVELDGVAVAVRTLDEVLR